MIKEGEGEYKPKAQFCSKGGGDKISHAIFEHVWRMFQKHSKKELQKHDYCHRTMFPFIKLFDSGIPPTSQKRKQAISWECHTQNSS